MRDILFRNHGGLLGAGHSAPLHLHGPPCSLLASYRGASEPPPHVPLRYRLGQRNMKLKSAPLCQSLSTSASARKAEDEVDWPQLRSHFVAAAAPMFGFGLMDNLVMIQAGELLDTTIGVTFGLSTLTAAAFGQIFSDISGVCFGGTVETIANKLGVQHPHFTEEQRGLRAVRTTGTLGRIVGVTCGCLLGMCSLLFMDLEKTEMKKKQAELETMFPTMMKSAEHLLGAQCRLYLRDDTHGSWIKYKPILAASAARVTTQVQQPMPTSGALDASSRSATSHPPAVPPAAESPADVSHASSQPVSSGASTPLDQPPSTHIQDSTSWISRMVSVLSMAFRGSSSVSDRTPSPPSILPPAGMKCGQTKYIIPADSPTAYFLDYVYERKEPFIVGAKRWFPGDAARPELDTAEAQMRFKLPATTQSLLLYPVFDDSDPSRVTGFIQFTNKRNPRSSDISNFRREDEKLAKMLSEHLSLCIALATRQAHEETGHLSEPVFTIPWVTQEDPIRTPASQPSGGPSATAGPSTSTASTGNSNQGSVSCPITPPTPAFPPLSSVSAPLSTESSGGRSAAIDAVDDSDDGLSQPPPTSSAVAKQRRHSSSSNRTNTSGREDTLRSQLSLLLPVGCGSIAGDTDKQSAVSLLAEDTLPPSETPVARKELRPVAEPETSDTTTLPPPLPNKTPLDSKKPTAGDSSLP